MASLGNGGVHISISSNLKEVEKYYSKVQRHIQPKHYGFALNDTARDVTKILNKFTAVAFDKPNAFTKKAFGYIRSRSSQKTIAEKFAWFGLKGQSNIPTSNAKPLKKGFTTGKITRAYNDIFRRLTPKGGRSIRLPIGTTYMYYPSAHSQKGGYMMSNGTLNYNKIKSSLNKSSRFFVGIPRGGPKQGQHYNGIWHREGVTKDKPAGEKIKMVVKLVTMQPYNKKSYMYDRWVKQNYPKLIR